MALYTATPANLGVQRALAYNHLSAIPADWAIDSHGQLVSRSKGTLIAEGEPWANSPTIWGTILRALPYLGAAVGGGALAGAIGGGAGSAASGGFSTGLGATGAAETAGLLGGYGTVAGVGGATAAGVGGATAAGLAGTGGTAAALPSTTIGSGYLGGIAGGTGGIGAGTAGGLTAGSGTLGSLPASGGIWGNLAKGAAAYKSGKSIWDSIYGAGQDAGALALGRADARREEALAQQRQDQLALERYQAGLSGAGVDIAQRNFALQAPGQRASNAVRGDVLANAQDVSFSGLPPRLQGMIPTISGGLRPSMFSPATRQLGGLLSSQALEGQQKGDTFAPLPDLPQATPLPSGNALDTGLTLGGTAASLAPSFWDLLSRYRKRNAGTPDYGSGGSDGSGGSTDTPGWDTGYG